MACQYELERDKRIQANMKRLNELVPLAQTIATAQADNEPTGEIKRAHRKQQPVTAHNGPRRSSSRLEGVAAVSYVEEGARMSGARPSSGVGRRSGERGQYGVEGATSCHSCRQCTSSYKAFCTRCSIKWCTACLRIRYGENAEEANETGVWTCGKCRGNCLCSNCRRKEGKAPTGVLGAQAQMAGYGSVSAYLDSGHI
jgi:hypothetical protein